MNHTPTGTPHDEPYDARADTAADTAADVLLDDAIRRHDVADATMTPDRIARRDALLTRILAAPPADDAAAPVGEPAEPAQAPALLSQARERRGRDTSGAPARRSRAVRVARWALPAAAAAGLAGVLALTGGPSTPAYASWTPRPTPVTGAERQTAETACRANLAESLRTMADVPADQRPTVDPQAVRTVVAERRGDFVFLSMADDRGSTSQCFFEAGDLSQVRGATGGLATAQSAAPVALTPGQVEAGGAGASSGPEGSYAFTTGRVAAGTRAVTIRTGGQTIQASLAGQHFAAWWPQRVLPPNSVNPPIAYDVTTAAGTVVTDARDVLGSQPPAPGPREIGAIATGGGASQDGSVATVSGRAGAQVASVTVHVDGRTIEAPVTDQVFTAQWPSPATSDPGAMTFDVHLRDGTVLRDQRPVR